MMTNTESETKKIIHDNHDDLRMHNAHGGRRIDEHNAAGCREDSNQSAESVDNTRDAGRKADEVELLRRELQRLNDASEKKQLKLENENLKKDNDLKELIILRSRSEGT